MTARPHITHHDDCGCLSARHAQQIADANAAIRRLQARLDAVRDVVRAACLCEYCPVGDDWLAHCDALSDATLALPADVRAWAEGGGE